MSAYHFQKCGLPWGFRLYDITGGGGVAGGRLLALVGPTARAFDLADLALPAGKYVLAVTAVDAFGTESDPDDARTVRVVIGTGGQVQRGLAGVREVRAWALVAGAVGLSWTVAVQHQAGVAVVLPAAFDVFFGEEPPPGIGEGEIEVVGNGGVQYRVDVALGTHGVADGVLTRVWVRSSDGEADGVRGVWVDGGRVRVDATGPASPAVVLPRIMVC